MTKTYSPVVKDNNKRVYRINKEDLLKNNGISDNLIGKLNEFRGDTLVVEIWDDKYERNRINSRIGKNQLRESAWERESNS